MDSISSYKRCRLTPAAGAVAVMLAELPRESDAPVDNAKPGLPVARGAGIG